MKITFNQNIQPRNQAEICKHLDKALWLVPAWVQSIHCNMWDGDEAGTRIAINVHYDYRNVCLDFYTAWLDENDEDKAKQVLHEFVHIHLSLIADFARDKFNLLCPASDAEKFNKSLQDELCVRHESATCDLTQALFTLNQ